MCRNKSLQKYVIVISMCISCLVVLLGILSFFHQRYMEVIMVFVVVNLSLAIVLLCGAKSKDTTHILVWLFFSFMQGIGLFLGMCYFAYQSEQSATTGLAQEKACGTVCNKTSETTQALRINDVVYSVIFGVITILHILISIIVKEFYNELVLNEFIEHKGR